MEIQYLTNNACFNNGNFIVKGVMVHSTGCNNPNVKRYVPGNERMGYNTNGNHWDQYAPGGRKVCVHGFLGKFANGSIGFVQTLPWNKIAYHCGGDANYSHISFEICEDDLSDENYCMKTYILAVEIVSMLCKKYNLNPNKKGVIVCHSEGYKLGIASNHGDIMHWWPKFGLNMDQFRKDVINKMKEEVEMTEEDIRKIVRDEYNKIMLEIENENADSWALPYIKEGIALGLTSSLDGKTMERPKSAITRQEALTMNVAAVKAAKGEE